MHIIVHKTNFKEAKIASDYIFNKLNMLYPNIPRRLYDGSLITLGIDFFIDFRFGMNPDKMGGLIVNYYHTDDTDLVADVLEQSASKRGGKRLKNLDQVVQIVTFYMDMFSEIDEYLEKYEK